MAKVEYRAAAAPSELDDSGAIVGLATPFNTWTMIGKAPWGFRERSVPSTFTKTLQEADTVYLDSHDPAKPVARKSAGTLEIRASERGLEWRATPTADTSYIRDLRENIRAGNITGCSFGFEVVKDHWEVGADGVDERTLIEVKLPEISSVTFPAYGGTEIGLRDARTAAREGRAAKANYADLYTCGDCGSTGEYGDFCSQCGSSMRDRDDDGDQYCTSCGASLSGRRSAHVCKNSETRLRACLAEARELFGQIDAAQLPEPVARAYELVLSHENAPAEGEPKPDSSTSDSDSRRRVSALMAARMRAAEPLS